MYRFLLFVAVCAMVQPRIASGQGPIRQTSASAAQLAKETTDYREFEIRVDNKPRGIHSLTIKSDGERHEVEMKSDVRVDVIVYAYVFKFRGKEVWRDGQCILSDIRTEDGGKKRDFFFKTDGKKQQVQFNGQPMPADLTGRMTTAYWMLPAEEHRQKAFGIFDVDTGNTRTATMKLVEEASINCNGRSIGCDHYRIEGPSPADLWFDADGRMVQQKSIEQGHATELRLKKIEISKSAK